MVEYKVFFQILMENGFWVTTVYNVNLYLNFFLEKIWR
jgi:hypothetical protein